MIKEKAKGKFEQLYEKYRKPLFYIAIKILEDQDLAEDAVQDAFVKIFENLNKIDDIHCCKTKSYVMTIATNNSFNLYCKRKQYALPFEAIEELAADYMDTKMEEIDSFEEMIKKLPVIYREILTLKYIQGHTNAEIAEMLDISQVNVRKRLERAKRKIKESLKDRPNR